MADVANITSEERSGAAFGPLEDAPLVLAEVLSLPAAALAGLPVVVRFIVEGLGFARKIVLSSAAAADLDRNGSVVFSGAELEAIVAAAQAERLWSSDLKGFCLRKLHDPSFRLTMGLALGGAEPDPDAAWSFGRLLRWLDLELVGIELATGAPAADATAPAADGDSVAA